MMRTYKYAALLFVLFCMASCAKEVIPPGNASLTIIHAIPGIQPIRTNFSGQDSIWYRRAGKLSYGTFTPAANRFNVLPEPFALGLYQEPDTLAASDPLFLMDLNLPAGAIRTLFLTGTSEAPESILNEDKVPYYALGDSTMGVRFVNLSPGSPILAVNLQGSEPGSEMTELSYKTVTGFQSYPIVHAMEDYVFEFRDSSTGAVLASFTAAGVGQEGTASKPNTWLYHSFTLAVIGNYAEIEHTPLKILLIPHINN